MNKILILLFIVALPVWATPQTSDAALRAAQVPELPVTTAEGVSNFKGVTINPGATYLLGAVPAGVGSVDLSSCTSVGPGGRLTITPSTGGGSNIANIAGGASYAMTDIEFGSSFFSGSDATFIFSGFSVDPGIHPFTLQGGDGSSMNYTAGGAAKFIGDGNSWASLTLGVSMTVGAYFPGSNTGGSCSVSLESCTSMTTLTITSLTMFVGNSVTVELFDTVGCSNLVTLHVPAIISITFDSSYTGGGGGGEIDMEQCALSGVSSQALLDALVAGASPTNGFPMMVDISAGTNAPPTDGGTDAGILASYGYSVFTN